MSTSRPRRPNFKVIFLGASNCGKTQIMQRLFNRDYSNSTCGGAAIDFSLRTTQTGSEYFLVFSHPFCIGGWGPRCEHEFFSINAVVLMFSFDDHSSFDSLVDDWYPTAVEFSTDDQVPIYLLGGKCDIEAAQREVTDDEVQKFIRSTQSNQVVRGTEDTTRYRPILRYNEVSAKNNINIQEFFRECLAPLIEARFGDSNDDRANQHIDVDVEAKNPNTDGEPHKDANGGCSLM